MIQSQERDEGNKMKGYKLTDKNGQTFGGCQWGENITHVATGEGNELCSPDVVHIYLDPLLAVFANPIYGNYNPETMQLWECECSEIVEQDALKAGCKMVTTLKRIPVPVITLEQRITIAILCSKKVCKDKKWNQWADKWLDGSDRSRETASAAYYAAYYTAYYTAAKSGLDVVAIIHEVVDK